MAKAKTRIDRDKLRVHLHGLRKDPLLSLLYRAIDLLPAARLPELVKGHVQLDGLRPDKATAGALLEAVQQFREASLEGDYYEDFDVIATSRMRTASRGDPQATHGRLSRRSDSWLTISQKGDAPSPVHEI